MPRFELVDALKHCVRRHRPKECQRLVQGLVVELGMDEFCGKYSFDLRCKYEIVADLCVKERLDTGAVAGERERLFRFVPHGESEHTVELVETARAPFTKCF